MYEIIIICYLKNSTKRLAAVGRWLVLKRFHRVGTPTVKTAKAGNVNVGPDANQQAGTSYASVWLCIHSGYVLFMLLTISTSSNRYCAQNMRWHTLITHQDDTISTDNLPVISRWANTLTHQPPQILTPPLAKDVRLPHHRTILQSLEFSVLFPQFLARQLRKMRK